MQNKYESREKEMLKVMNKSVIAIIPAYNPTSDMITLVGQLRKSMEIVCINDGSKKENEWIFEQLVKMEGGYMY